MQPPPEPSATQPDPPVLAAARQYLAAYLEDKQAERESLHPWRKPWQFTYTHCLRVEQITLRLLAGEGLALEPDEAAALRLAAILHDIGRLDEGEVRQHAAAGARIAAAWLQRPEVAGQVPRPGLVIELIADHSRKNAPEPRPCHALLKDADTLDEIGAMSIFMAANWIDHAAPFFFEQLLARLIEHELPYCDRTLERLNTRTAREYLQQKRRFIQGFARELSEEIGQAPPAGPL